MPTGASQYRVDGLRRVMRFHFVPRDEMRVVVVVVDYVVVVIVVVVVVVVAAVQSLYEWIRTLPHAFIDPRRERRRRR